MQLYKSQSLACGSNRRTVVMRSSLERLSSSAKSKLQDLLKDRSLNRREDMELAVSELLLASPIRKDQAALQAVSVGQGTWEVFHAPHIERISSVLGASFNPITYVLRGDTLISNVKYSHPLLGSGWLSAGGTLGVKYDDTVEVKFDRFWIDGPETLREDITVSVFSPMSLDLDAWMTRIGRSLFFPQLALFPIYYLDNDICVFEFTPLNSKIAVKKVSTFEDVPFLST